MAEFDCLSALKAIGDENRLKILALLLKQPMTVNQIGEQLGVSQYNVSKHLRVLREANLVEVKVRGRFHEYTLASHIQDHVGEGAQGVDLQNCSIYVQDLLKTVKPPR